jgi:very-short-patch-repair endonuclease
MPAKRTTPRGYQRARELRKAPSPAELKLWAYLRGGRFNGVKFRRQHAIGEYIPDFCSIKHQLIIELDGPSFGRSIWNNKSMMMKGQSFWNHAAIESYGSGTTMS